jgi:hypothetical protein
MKIELTEKQVEVLQEALIYMGTEWGCQVSESKDKDFDIYYTADQKKAVRSKYRIAKNILPKLGLNKNENF